jgi:hypothetical protein
MPPAIAYFTIEKGTVPIKLELKAKGEIVINNEVENTAKNAIDGLPLLLHKKCHKLCINIEARIKYNAILDIRKTPMVLYKMNVKQY